MGIFTPLPKNELETNLNINKLNDTLSFSSEKFDEVAVRDDKIWWSCRLKGLVRLGSFM